MSIINENSKKYQALLNKNIVESIKNDENLDVEEFVKEYKQKNDILNLIFQDVVDLAKTANKYMGNLFGGIVRSFLLRKEDTSNINVWLVRDRDFIEDIKKNWSAFKLTELKLNELVCYELNERYHVTSPKTGFVYTIDIVFKDYCPVNDYDVNCLLFNGSSFLPSNNQSLKILLQHINNKEMYMLKTYQYSLSDDRKKNKFEKNNWKIMKNNYIEKTMGFFNVDDLYTSNNPLINVSVLNEKTKMEEFKYMKINEPMTQLINEPFIQ